MVIAASITLVMVITALSGFIALATFFTFFSFFFARFVFTVIPAGFENSVKGGVLFCCGQNWLCGDEGSYG